MTSITVDNVEYQYTVFPGHSRVLYQVVLPGGYKIVHWNKSVLGSLIRQKLASIQ